MKTRICAFLLLPFMVACENNISQSATQEEKLKTLVGQTVSTVVVSNNGSEIILITKEGSQFSFIGNRFGITVNQK